MSCADEPPVADQSFNASQEFNRNVKVELRHYYDLENGLDSLVSNATVLLFEDRDVFITNGYADKYRTTDTTGIALFEYLDKDYYYIRVVQPDLGEQTDSVSTPPNTTSFVFIDYL